MRKSILAMLLVASTQANAFGFFDSTFLIGLNQGSPLSQKAQSLSSFQGYESAGGTMVKFDKWYTSKWTDVRVDFVTQISKDFGILWGLSTGEKAPKYTIDPSFKLGAVMIHHFSKSSTLTLNGYYTFGGKLKEKSCTADYGEIGGVQEVNCRLAATELPPAETLKYLLNERPLNYKVVNVQFRFEF